MVPDGEAFYGRRRCMRGFSISMARQKMPLVLASDGHFFERGNYVSKYLQLQTLNFSGHEFSQHLGTP